MAEPLPTTSEAASAPPSRNLYVTGVDPCVTEPELLQLFLQYGVVEQHKLMVNIKTGLSRGFGFVMFRDIEDAIAALSGLNGFLLYGKPLEVKYAADKTRTPGAPTRRLFIRNIPVGEHSTMEQMCAQFGKVLDVKFYWDDRRPTVEYPNSPSATIVAFVEMSTVAEAQSIVHGLNNSLKFTEDATLATTTTTTTAPNPHPRYRPLQVKLISSGMDDDITSRVGPPYIPGQASSAVRPSNPSSSAASARPPYRQPQSKTMAPATARQMPTPAVPTYHHLHHHHPAFLPASPYQHQHQVHPSMLLQQHHHHHASFLPVNFPVMMVPAPAWGPPQATDPVTGLPLGPSYLPSYPGPMLQSWTPMYSMGFPPPPPPPQQLVPMAMPAVAQSPHSAATIEEVEE